MKQLPQCPCKDYKHPVIHVYWCPHSKEVKRYKALPWHKKLFTRNPQKI